ncbi:MAG: Hsp70 family protein [Ilumatobacteraceae bacterium]
MGYSLGVDLGTTFTAAAVERDGRVDVVPLGNHAATIPSLVFLRDDDGVLIGDAAQRRGVQEPARLAREFKRRFGDTTPILLHRTPVSAERLTGMMLRQIVDDISTRQGGPPDAVGIAHPANWGQFKLDLLRQSAQMAGLSDATFVSEPVAAAAQFASTERVEVGDIVAVYDLGGGTFDAAILSKTATGFDTLGQPQGIERLGGIDFDEAVFAHVRQTIGEAIEQLDTSDPAVRAALARLRAECVAAKEALSADSETTIPVLLANVQTQVRLTRSEFEDMIRPTLRETVESLRRAIDSAGISTSDVKSIVLVGGSARIPLVAELVRSEFGRPVATDTHPKHAVAMGAARVATVVSRAASPAPVTPVTDRVVVSPDPAVVTASPTTAPAAVPMAAAAAVPPGPAATTPPAGNTKVKVAIGLVAVVAIGAVGFALSSGGGGGSASDTTTSAPRADSSEVDSAGAVTSAATETTETTSTTEAPTTTVATTTTSTLPDPTCGASGLCVGLLSVDLVGGSYVATYQTSNFDPLIGGDGTHHVHFFYDTVPIEQAGMPGAGPWVVWDRASGNGELVFDGYAVANQATDGGADATELCVAVANSDHSVQPDTLDCLVLPS